MKKRSGSLSYADDPSGIRSLLSRVSVPHTAGAPGAAAGQQPPLLFEGLPRAPRRGLSRAAADGAQGCAGIQAVPGGGGRGGDEGAGAKGGAWEEVEEEEEEEGGRGAEGAEGSGVAGLRGPGAVDADSGGSNDMVHLCATFSADPSIMALAQLLKQLGALQGAAAQRRRRRRALQGQPPPGHLHTLPEQQAQRQGLRQRQQRDVQGRGEREGRWRARQARQCAALLHFCTSSLYECITAEKAELLAAHLKLYCLVLGYCQVCDARRTGKRAHG